MVSIIMPTYNRAHLIKATIDSVLNQSYADIELIIVDDGSTDDTEFLIKSYNDNRIIYIKREHSGYIGQLRNIGLERSTGEFIALLDSDDVWQIDKLQEQIHLLTIHQKAGFCISDVNVMTGDTVLKERTYKQSEGKEITNIFDRLKENNFWVYPSTKLFRRSCLEKTGLFHENIRSSDFNFTIRLAYYFDAVIQYKTLVTRYVHESNRSSLFSIPNYADYLATFDFLLKNNMITKKDAVFARWNAHYKIADIYRGRKEYGAALTNYKAALSLKPFHLKSYKNILYSLIRN